MSTPNLFMNSDDDCTKLFQMYEAGNFTEVIARASHMIEKPAEQFIGEAWIYKGLSFGSLSSLQEPHLSEMIENIKYGKKIGVTRIDSRTVSVQVAKIVNNFNVKVLTYYSQIIYDIRNQKPPTIILQPSSTRSISESIGAGLGAGIGAGIANSIIISQEVQKQSLRFGLIYQSAYQVSVINAMKFAWDLDKSLKTAILLNDTIGKLFSASCFLPEFKALFKSQIISLLDGLTASFPNLTRPTVS